MLDGTFEWEEEDSLVYFYGKLYISLDIVLHWDIVKSCHNASTAGHPGQSHTLELVSHHYCYGLRRVLP
jgi:hypothetical protein